LQGRIKLFSQFIHRPGRSLGTDAVWQLPRSLFAKRQRQKFPEGELLLIAICSNTDRNGVLRHVTAQGAV